SMKSRHSRRAFLAQSAMAGVGAPASHPVEAFRQAREAAVDRASLASRPSDLRITDVKCGFIRGGASLFVKIHTNQGIWGSGEGVDAVRGTYHLVMDLGRRLRDRNPLDVHRIFEELRRGGVFGGAQSGMYVAVLSAIETALRSEERRVGK